jgi:hypothetical protein
MAKREGSSNKTVDRREPINGGSVAPGDPGILGGNKQPAHTPACEADPRFHFVPILVVGSLVSGQAALFQYTLNFSDAGEANPSPSLAGGVAYWNIHTAFGTGGEIRAFATPATEPGTPALVALGILGLIARAWKKRGSTAG